MATPEGTVKRHIDKWLKANLPLVYIYKPPGGAFGRGGTPDYHLCWRGIFIAIEAKADKEATALQMARLKAIQRAGGIAVLIRNTDEVYTKLPTVKRLVLERSPWYVYPDAVSVADARGAKPVPAPEGYNGVSASE